MGKFTFLIFLTICKFSRGNGCSYEEFDCGNGICINISWVCDGTDDCANSKDEELCAGRIHEKNKCGSNLFKCESYAQCIPKKWKCDGTVDCVDRSDEMHCENENTCSSSQFMCASDKLCIPVSWKCDRFADCEDRSDEMHCNEKKCPSDQFDCGNGECISPSRVCDGSVECGNGNDERNCPEVKKCPSDQFDCENGQCISLSWVCDGSVECGNGNDEKNCPEEGIIQKEKTCSSSQFMCASDKLCVPVSWKCDGATDCNDRSDEMHCNGIEDFELIFFNERSNIHIKKRRAGYELLNSLPLSSRMAKITGLSFQPKTEVLYIADGERPAIYAVNISSLHEQELVTNHLSSPEDIAFDWRSDNLYWVDAYKGTTEVISVDTLKRIVLIEDLSKPVSLAISPYDGIMFIAEVSFEAWISIFEMDGTNKRILHSVEGLPMSLSLHPSETLLYWSDTRKEEISYANYSSTSPPRTLKRVAGVMSVAVSEDRIFYTTEDPPLQSEGIPAEKVHEMKLLEYGKDKNWKSITYIYGRKHSKMSDCLIENGGCGYLCLTSPKGRTCACPSAMKLDTDGRTCIGKLLL